MEKEYRILLQLLIEISKCNHNLRAYQMPIDNVKKLFKLRDTNNKGYLDLADMYQLVGEVTQDQLFIIFKYFDIEKQDKIFLNNFISTLGKQGQSYNKNAHQQFLDYIQVLKHNYSSLESKKISLGINKQFIRNIFQKVCSFYRKSNQLSKAQLIKFLKQQQGFNNIILNELNSIFLRESISQAEFFNCLVSVNQIPCFNPYQSNQYQSHIQYKNQNQGGAGYIYQKTPIQNSNKQSQIIVSKEYNNYINDDKSYKSVNITNYLQNKRPQTPNNFNDNKKQLHEKYGIQQEKYYSNNYPQQFNTLNSNSLEKKQLKNQNLYASAAYQNFNQNYKQSQGKYVNQIQKRREQLRKDSLERQKIIQDVINRRKSQNNLYDQVKRMKDNKLNIDRDIDLNVHKYGSLSKKNGYTNNKHQFNKTTDYNFRVKDQQQLIGHRHPEIYNKLFHQNFYENRQLYNDNNKQLSYTDTFSKYARKNDKYEQLFLNRAKDSSCGWRNDDRYYQKQNILKKAEEQAARKIEQIQRKARMKVLEKKSSTGCRWVK